MNRLLFHVKILIIILCLEVDCYLNPMALIQFQIYRPVSRGYPSFKVSVKGGFTVYDFNFSKFVNVPYVLNK